MHLKGNSFRFAPTLVVRTPVLSYQHYSPANLDEILQQQEFRDAILVASSSLYQQLKKVDFQMGKLDQKKIVTLTKYYNRMAFRPVPFGLFSSTAVTEWGQDEKVRVGFPTVHFRNSFENDFRTIVQLKGQVDRRLISYSANQTTYRTGTELRYLGSYLNEELNSVDFNVCSVKYLPWLEKLLSLCTEKQSFGSIVTLASMVGDLENEDAERWVEELIELKLLVDDMIPNISGESFGGRIRALREKDQPGLKTMLPRLPEPRPVSEAGNLMSEFVKNSNDVYINLVGAPIGGSLHVKYQESILRAITCLSKIGKLLNAGDGMKDFKAIFKHRFGNRQMPLLEMMDPQIGIGYRNLAANASENELLHNINWDVPKRKIFTLAWTRLHQLIMDKWVSCGGTHTCNLITLEDKDVDSLDNPDTQLSLPSSISVMFRVLDDKVLIENAGGVTATSLIGRFTPFDESFKSLAAGIVDAEIAANPDVIFAEIAHVCNLHTANINIREHIYHYEIPVLTESAVSSDRQIPLSDLLVAVVDDQVMLFSKTQKKRIIPRLSSAFSYTRNNLAIFQFLCDLQSQGVQPYFRLDLAELFPDLKYYPRVEYHSTILCPEKWHLSTAEFDAVMGTDGILRMEEFVKVKNKWALPRWISLVNHDQQLVFDLEVNEQVSFFLQNIKTYSVVELREVIAETSDDACCVNDHGQPLAGQFIAALLNDARTYQPKTILSSSKHNRQRNTNSGNDWVYFKLYCHPVQVFQLLGSDIKRFIQMLFQKGLIMDWFYVLYPDPDYHIRLRFRVGKQSAGNLVAELRGFLNKLLGRKMLNNFEMCVYEPEIERYGGTLIRRFEDIFCRSSRLVVEYFDMWHNSGDLDMVITAFMDMRSLMDGAGMHGQNRLTFLERVNASFATEFSMDHQLKVALDQKYRQIESGLVRRLDKIRQKSNSLITESTAFLQSVEALFSRNKKKDPEVRIQWLGDIIHMHLNRLFIEEERKQEFIMYHILLKYERTQQKQKKSGSSNEKS